MAWVDHRNYPGGPLAWIGLNFEPTVGTIQDAAYVVANFLADGSMVCLAQLMFNNRFYSLLIRAPDLPFICDLGWQYLRFGCSGFDLPFDYR